MGEKKGSRVSLAAVLSSGDAWAPTESPHVPSADAAPLLESPSGEE